MVDGETPLISVVIPVKNGDRWLDRTIPAILGQRLSAKLEIIIIDSGSTDQTIEILKNYPVQLLTIPAETFNHGSTRNLGAEKAKGKYVVMTVQDAEPANEYWLQYLLAGFDDDSVAGVCGQQVVPHETNMNPVYWFRPVSQPDKKKYRFDNREDFDKLLPSEQRYLCRWDNVTAMYRRDILLQLPFGKVKFCEDALWAKDALRAGYGIVYDTNARVKHYHFEIPDYTFRRSLAVYYHMNKFFGVLPSRTSNGTIQIVKNLKLLIQVSEINWEQKLKWLFYNYNERKSINKAVHVFLDALGKGQQALDRRYSDICVSVPQALKPGI